MNFSNYLSHIAGVSIYPVISLTLFVVFFSIVIVRTVRMNKDEVKHMENLPLNDEN